MFVRPALPLVSRLLCTMTSPIVQYIVVRSDLDWPTGALIGTFSLTPLCSQSIACCPCSTRSHVLSLVSHIAAQGAHASVAAISQSLDQADTQSYLNELETMHKVVLKAESEEQVQQLVQRLSAAGIRHYAWIERPEDILAAVASAPGQKSVLQSHFKGFKLFK